MNIVAIGAMPSDLEFGCFATLSKYIREGHDISLIIANDSTESSTAADWNEMTIGKIRESSSIIGITELYFAERFDYSAVTQENANVLNSFIKTINPSLIIMPFWKAIHNRRRVLAKTSLIACRGFGIILMYELEENKDFAPTIYFQVSTRDAYAKKGCLFTYCDLPALTTNTDVYNKMPKGTSEELNLLPRKGHQLLALSQEYSEINHGISGTTENNDNHDADKARYLNYPINICLDKPDIGIESISSSQQTILRYCQNLDRRIPIEAFESHRMLLVENSTGF